MRASSLKKNWSSPPQAPAAVRILHGSGCRRHDGTADGAPLPSHAHGGMYTDSS